MQRKKVTPWWIWLIVVTFIIIVIAIYIASLGTVNISDEEPLPPEFKDTKDEALRKHKALQVELDKKIAIRDKLNRKFKVAYLTVRILLITICAVSVFYIGYLLGAKTLEDFLNYYEASIIILFALNFIAFGTIANFHDFILVLKTKVENWVWLKNVSLPKEIETVTQEMAIIKEQL